MREKKIVELYESGLSLRKVAKIAGVSYEYIRRRVPYDLVETEKIERNTEYLKHIYRVYLKNGGNYSVTGRELGFSRQYIFIVVNKYFEPIEKIKLVKSKFCSKLRERPA